MVCGDMGERDMTSHCCYNKPPSFEIQDRIASRGSILKDTKGLFVAISNSSNVKCLNGLVLRVREIKTLNIKSKEIVDINKSLSSSPCVCINNSF